MYQNYQLALIKSYWFHVGPGFMEYANKSLVKIVYK